MTRYHFVAASRAFLLEEEPLEEVLRERAPVHRADVWVGRLAISVCRVPVHGGSALAADVTRSWG